MEVPRRGDNDGFRTVGWNGFEEQGESVVMR